MARWVFADDLTGAMEAATVGSKPAMVAWEPEPLPDQDELVFNLATRDLNQDALVRNLARWTSIASGARLAALAQKMDSWGRGHWAAELAWLARIFQRPRVLVAPTLPDEGRSVQGGRILHRGSPVCDLRKSLEAVGLAVRLWTEAAPLDADHPAEVQVWVADATTSEDLRRLVKMWPYPPQVTLMVGSRGLLSVNALERREWPRFSGPILILVGSLHADRLGQLAALDAVVPLVSLRAMEAAARLKSGQDTVLTSIDGEVRDPTAAQRQWQRVLPDVLGLGWGAVVVTGGATAEVVLQVARARAIHAIAPLPGGSALGRVEGGLLDGTLIATKSGSFGGEDALVQVYHGLDGCRNGGEQHAAKTRN